MQPQHPLSARVERTPAFAARLVPIRDAAAEWCAGRSGWVRLPVLAYGAWILFHALTDPYYASWFAGLNLGIHELGHVIVSPLGRWPGIASGSLFQVLAPIAAMFVFWRQGDRFAIAFAFGWLSASLFEVARYAGDARAMDLPLVSPFAGAPIHDWNWMLSELGILSWDQGIATSLRAGAVLSMLAFLGAGGWLVWRMIRGAR